MLGEVEARTLTEYLARAIESREQRDYRHTVKIAARKHRGRPVISLEIYAERQIDETIRERYLEMARGEAASQEREVTISQSRR
jgi:hypothetical protein